jgi:four helix bundle protein
MFDFEKLEVYRKAKLLNLAIHKMLLESRFDRVTNDQLRRASFSIMLNIAEGSSRFSNRDRKNFQTISRGSVFECAAILEYLSETGELEIEKSKPLSQALEEISKMLYALIRKLE